MNVLRALYETLWKFINTVTTSNYRRYIGKILNDSENVYV